MYYTDLVKHQKTATATVTSIPEVYLPLDLCDGSSDCIQVNLVDNRLINK